MTNWRMSFRVGSRGYEMWPHCRDLSIAAITYSPLARVNLSKHPKNEPRNLWAQLEASQIGSLRRVAYDMAGGDVIYVKQGAKIVGKGVVKGPRGKPAYRFRLKFLRPPVEGEPPWLHQVPVKWQGEFPEIPIDLKADLHTVKKLTENEVRRIEQRRPAASKAAAKRDAEASRLLEDAYFRASKASLKKIIPRHKKLSNAFCDWLDETFGIQSQQESDRVDVSFLWNDQDVLAELKVCLGAGSKKAIREALGQILEYNHYPPRRAMDLWLIVLDQKPSTEDFRFIDILRNRLSLPLTVAWQTKKHFSFYPDSPFD